MDISEQSVKDHYGMLLGIDREWMVQRVEYDAPNHCIEAWAQWRVGEALACPKCHAICPGYDHLPERTWRHLDACGYITLLHARIPRCKCPEHGVVSVRANWAEPGSRYTLAFEQHVIEVLSSCSNLTKAAQQLRMDWTAVHRVMRRSVERGLTRRLLEPIAYLGIDEKSFGRGQSYGSVVSDLGGKRVLEVLQNRDEQAAREVLEAAVCEPLRSAVRAVAMDMWKPFVKAVGVVLPDADIVFDKFHMVRLLGDSVDKVRKEEHRLLQSKGDTILSGSKYWWLKAPGNLSVKQWSSFKELLAINLKTSRAWTLAQTFDGFWQCESAAQGRQFFKEWYGKAKRSKLPPIKAAADTLNRHLEGMLTYFKHRITNASAEGLNSLIQLIKSAARGFRNFANYRTTILFYLGKLDMNAINTHTIS